MTDVMQSSLWLRSAVASVGVGVLLLLSARDAAAYDESSAAVASNTGLHFGIGPMLLVPSDGGPLGGGLAFDLRYGIGVDPVIIAPGGRLIGYFISGRFVGIGMPTARVTLPLGPLAPYVLGGIGGGWLSNPSEGGVALMGGGGLMIHFGRILAIGAEATYQTVTSTELHGWAIGPQIAIGL